MSSRHGVIVVAFVLVAVIDVVADVVVAFIVLRVNVLVIKFVQQACVVDASQ